MNETLPPPAKRSREKVFLIWAITATVAALVFGNAAFFLFLRARNAPARAESSPFLQLKEESIPGRYKWIEGGEEHGVMTLREDHTFLPPRGQRATPQPFHRWEMGREGLLILWLKDTDRFTRMEAPGIYLATKPDGRVVRMEKVE